MSKHYKKTKRRRRSTKASRMEKDAVEIYKRGILTLSKNHYLVPSKKKYYKVQYDGLWSCNCEYAVYHPKCKHICAVQIMLNDEAEPESVTATRINEPTVRCPECKSQDCLETTSYTAKRGEVPVHICKCKHRFVFRPGFNNRKFDDNTISSALFLCSTGLPVRRVAEFLLQSGVKVHHSTIFRWTNYYSEVMTTFAKTLPFQVGDRWSVDELYILTYPPGAKKECKYWLFAIMDNKTGMILSYRMAPMKHGYDATELFEESIEIAEKTPDVMLSDALATFKKAVKKTMPDTKHIADVGINGKHVHNNQRERLNGELKENLSRARGYKTLVPSRVKLQIIYHNFIHETNGTVPAEAAGIFIEGANKIKTLIQNAALAST